MRIDDDRLDAKVEQLWIGCLRKRVNGGVGDDERQLCGNIWGLDALDGREPVGATEANADTVVYDIADTRSRR